MKNNQLIISTLILTASTLAIGQDRSVILEEVLVTATKKAKAEELQDVAISATAYNSAQLEALQFRDLQSLSYSIPNVSMDDVGTTKGYANFSFRGLGINSSIPSIDPTVGVFVDGVYLGTNGGVVFDQFDLEGIEILRGPQGVLFGRNVTGGAVLMRTGDPTPELEGSVKASMESGRNVTYQARLSGPIKEDKLLGKFAAYYNDDGGYHENLANGNDEFGQSSTTILRGAVTYFIGDDGASDIMLKYEKGKQHGDGPAAQNHAIHDRHSFDFTVNEEGKSDAEWEMAALTYTRDIGEGTLTHITGFREYESETAGDIDGLAANAFHSRSYSENEQYSTELRYNVLVNDAVDVTFGFYYFTQDLTYVEHRALGAALTVATGGGELTADTRALFASADWIISDSLTFTTGARVTKERKDADVAEISFLQPCSVDNRKCNSFNFSDRETWTNFSPKLGLQWFPNDTSQVYMNLTRGFRSGGYNLRDTDAAATGIPGPFDEEEQDSIEIGAKYTSEDGRTRANVAVFQNEITDMQRELNTPSTGLGVNQVIVNSADATITGAEFELLTQLDEHFVFGLNGGYLDGDYDKIKTDISGDGVVTDADKSLALPRLAEVTYGANLTWENQMSDGDRLMARVSFNHRDEAAYTDTNLGTLNAADMVDAMVSLNSRNNVTITIYGKNLKDEVTHGGDTQLPAAFGGAGASFAPLNKGKVYGASIQYDFW